jgi:hypothetical protein
VRERRFDLSELAARVRRRGLLRALAEGPAPPTVRKPPPVPARPQPPAEAPTVAPTDTPPELAPQVPVEEPPPPPPPPPVDPALTERLAGCTLACSAVITGLADLPAVPAGDQVLDVALLRLRVRRPERDVSCCVRQHIPPEVRGVLGPGAGVMVLAHEHQRQVAVVDWTATGNWLGTQLTFPTAPEQYEWPPEEEWPASGEIEVHDVNGQREELDRRRTEWRFGWADLLALTPLRTRMDQRDEWRITLELADGSTMAIKDRVPVLAVARLRAGEEDRVGTPIHVLVSSNGDVVIDWEATLRQPGLRSSAP